MRGFMGSFGFLVFLILLDLYIFQALRLVTTNSNPKLRIVIYVVFWLLAVAVWGLFFFLPQLKMQDWSTVLRNYVMAITMGLVLGKLLTLPFLVIDDLRRGIQWIVQKIGNSNKEQLAVGTGISRSVFMSWLGLGIGGTLFGTLLYGFRNKYNYQVQKQPLSFKQLPASFNGFKVVQLSDIHSGSFMDKAAVAKGVTMINDLKPDLILFTGDLVNDKAEEIEPYLDVFSKLLAKYGVFSTLGNHDYGDYVQWPDRDAQHRAKEAEIGSRFMTPLQSKNLEKLKDLQHQMGWKMLNDDAVKINNGTDEIAIIGVQNISGKGNFHSYGNLEKAYAPAIDTSFKILMSHDPSHWDSEVRTQYPDIALMLSGHTHGMQFGVEIPGLKWSPVQWMYKQWAGLYESDTNKLYINRGYGFIGYPGRVGILPEITLITLNQG